MLILLPPSEGKADGGSGKPFAESHPEWVGDVEPVIKHVKRLSRADRRKFYGAKDDAKAAEIQALNLHALEAPTMMAIERYTGVVYQHIDYASLKKKAAARRRIQIVSGLFGLVGADAKLPPYKMPMNPWLVKYWKAKNSGRLAAKAKDKPVLNLLSSSYAKAIDIENAIHVDFRVAGGKKSAGHFGKAIKGKFVRFLIENDIKSSKDFPAFNEDGYTFDGENFIQG